MAFYHQDFESFTSRSRPCGLANGSTVYTAESPVIFHKLHVLLILAKKASASNVSHCWPPPHKDPALTLYCTSSTVAILLDSQCMHGFLDEGLLRSKAALIGRTVSRQQEQVLVPAVKFTCEGRLTGWRFVAERLSGRGRTEYPEIQVWRPQTSSPSVYEIVQSVRVSPQSTSQRNVYTHTLTTPISYQAGDVLGIYHPASETAVYKILSVQHGGPNNYYTQRQESSSVRFNTQSLGVRVHRDYPLVGAQTSQSKLIPMILIHSVSYTQTIQSASLGFSARVI